MKTEELNNQELTFIEIIRAFDFLFKEGYHGKQFSIGGREPGIIFENWVANRIIHIYWSESGFLDVSIKRKKMFAKSKAVEFSIKDFFKHFNCDHIRLNPPVGSFNILKTNADFIQQHLMPVIKGEMWIDELLKQHIGTNV